MSKKANPINPHPVELGRRYRDTVTDFEGTCIMVTYHLNGCVQAGLEGKATKDEKEIPFHGYDTDRLVDLETSAPAGVSGKPGGSYSDASGSGR